MRQCGKILGEITVASVGKISGKSTFALDGDTGGEFYNILVNKL